MFEGSIREFWASKKGKIWFIILLLVILRVGLENFGAILKYLKGVLGNFRPLKKE